MTKRLTTIQIFARESLKLLTSKQREIWFMRRELNEVEIAAILGISHQAVSKHLKEAEKRINKFGESFKTTFKTINDAQPKEELEEKEWENGEQAADGWAHKTPIRGNPDETGLHKEWE